MIKDIPEEDFTNQIEIIGWLYQYYNSERKDEVINIIKGKISKKDIPAATQLFTTDWVVKYMVDNSLGRYWIERNEKTNLKNTLKYYLNESEQSSETTKLLKSIRNENVSPDSIKFLDPCMGSGHILIYAFDIFMEIYREFGYLDKDIPELILNNNLFGLDIDNRAYQLAYFALMMKARQYDRKILGKNITPNILPIKDAKQNKKVLDYIKDKNTDLYEDICYLLDIFKSGKEFGSLIQVKNLNYNNISESVNDLLKSLNSTLSSFSIKKFILNEIVPIIKQAKILSLKYDIVVTNPPYMNKFESSLKNFATKHYKDYSKDLFSMFIYRNFEFCKENGYSALMTPFVWMFIKNYEKLRKYIISEKNISSLIQLEYSAFSEATVPICTFVLCNNKYDYKGTYLRLSDFKGGMDVQNEKVLEAINEDVDFKFEANVNSFSKIPGNPIAYWADKKLLNAFDYGITIKDYGISKKGIVSGNNDKFLRMHWEIDKNKIGEKWFYCVKGGKYRKYYGNIERVIDLSNDAQNFYKLNKSSSMLNKNYLFKEGITYNNVTSSKIGFRYLPKNVTFSNGGPSILNLQDNLFYILGFLNSNIKDIFLNILNPTINLNLNEINLLPIIIDDYYKNKIENLTKECIEISKENWDFFEISHNYKTHPFLIFKAEKIKKSCNLWKNHNKKQISLIESNEIEINELFFEIYSLNIENKHEQNTNSTLKEFNIEEDIKSFVSYFVGCLFGRYSLDKEGLISAGTFNIQNYKQYTPDEDNIVPILDNDYFDDDIVNRFEEFLKTCFGTEYHEENLEFIAKTLKKKGNTTREIIRNYFLNDFFKDHTKTYQKRPIYWQFDSGKQNGFKCLIYMHRYTPDTLARIRTEYLHKTQKAYETQLEQQKNLLNNTTESKDKTRLNNEIKKLTKQIQEIQKYDETLATLADQNIQIDLDDGVKNNYKKFKNILKKIN